MNILVCSKLSIPARNQTLPDWSHAKSLGHQVEITCFPYSIGFTPDVIIGMGVGSMEETFIALSQWPDAMFYAYNWDCYAWVWDNPRPKEYDYHRYGRLIKEANEIWVPSECTRLRTKQWWNLDSYVILSSCPWWDYTNIRDEEYALCALRKIPDPHCDWFEKACMELNIPYRMTNHDCTYEEYQDAVASCRVLVSHYYEASTGGLTLLEGYYLGKPCLVSDSPWMGARDYLGSRATYFDHTSYDDFKIKLKQAVISPQHLDSHICTAWVAHNFSDQRMVDDILRRIDACL